MRENVSERKMIRFILWSCTFLMFLIFSTIPFAKSETACQSSKKKEIVKGELGKKIDQYLTRITPFGFSGALLVAKKGEIILNKGYGMAIRSTRSFNTSETVFSTGSITKQFTAAGIMKLEMQGKLNTSDLIAKFFKDVPEDKKQITLHHLLTHTSGVINYTGMDYEEAHRDETAKKVLEAPLLFKPGERFEYSNAGYSLLAAIIEKVSGKAYETFLNENLFKPAGMQFTGYRMPEWDKKVVAHWYVGEKDNGIPLDKPYPYWNLLGNGGILSTTQDMYKWHLALMGDTILSAEAMKKIVTPFLNDYGYGWDVLKTKRGTLIQHDGGSMLGNSAEIRRYINAGVVTILFCNQSFEGRALFGPIRDKIETLAFGGDVEIPPSVITMDAKRLQTFEGAYILSSGDCLEVKRKGGGLSIKAIGQDAVNMLFVPEKTDFSNYNELGKLSRTIFEAALKGNYKPFADVLFNKERRQERVREFIETRIQMHQKRTGEIRKVLALGTLPSDFNGEEVAMTIVRLKGERGSIFFGLYWRDRMNIGIGPMMSSPEFSISFMPMSDTEFAGYHLGIARNVSLSFSLDDKGVVEGLNVHKQDRDLFIRKEKNQS